MARPVSARKCPKRRLRQACLAKLHHFQSARALVDATLAQHGVTCVPMDTEVEQERFAVVTPGSNNAMSTHTTSYITEEELMELLQEVEIRQSARCWLFVRRDAAGGRVTVEEARDEVLLLPPIRVAPRPRGHQG